MSGFATYALTIGNVTMKFAERIIIIPLDYIILHLMTFSQQHIPSVPDHGVLHPGL